MLSKEDIKLLNASEELDQRVETFLDKYGVAKLTGRKYLKQMIIYQCNKEIYQREFNETLYKMLAEYNHTTKYAVLRLARYASVDANKIEPIYPIELMYRAWNEIKLEETEGIINYAYKCSNSVKISWSREHEV